MKLNCIPALKILVVLLTSCHHLGKNNYPEPLILNPTLTAAHWKDDGENSMSMRRNELGEVWLRFDISNSSGDIFSDQHYPSLKIGDSPTSEFSQFDVEVGILHLAKNRLDYRIWHGTTDDALSNSVLSFLQAEKVELTFINQKNEKNQLTFTAADYPQKTKAIVGFNHVDWQRESYFDKQKKIITTTTNQCLTLVIQSKIKSCSEIWNKCDKRAKGDLNKLEDCMFSSVGLK